MPKPPPRRPGHPVVEREPQPRHVVAVCPHCRARTKVLLNDLLYATQPTVPKCSACGKPLA